MKTKQKLEKITTDCQSTLDKAQKELAALDETTYSIADRFRCEYGKRMLVELRESNGAALIDLEDGRSIGYGGKVKNNKKITEKEFKNLCCASTLEYTRYWDSQRKELTE